MELPVEVVDHITTFLPYHDLLQFALTCKHHHQICYRKLNKPDYLFLYRHIKVAKHLTKLMDQFNNLYRICQRKFGTKRKLTRYLYKCAEILRFHICYQLRDVVEENATTDALEYFHTMMEEMYERIHTDLPIFNLKDDIANAIRKYLKFDKFLRPILIAEDHLLRQLNRMRYYCSKLQKIVDKM